MSAQLSLFIIVVVIVVGWFAAGTHLNVRKGHDALRWLQDGLPLVGEKTTVRWLGSSAVELKVPEAKPPFQTAEVMVILEPRDIPLIWWFSRLRGRRDLLIFRATLDRQPRTEFEVLDPTSWLGRAAQARAQRDEWTKVAAPEPLVAYSPRSNFNPTPFVEAAEVGPSRSVRLASRRDAPNLELHFHLADVKAQSSVAVFKAARQVAEKLL
jgi:hypothetical protein